MAIALAVAALGSGIATYLALTGAPPFGPGPQRRPDPAQPRSGPAAGAGGAVVAKRLVEVWARAAARPCRLAAAGPAGRAVQPDRGNADDHRRGIFLSVLQLRRRILVQRQGAHRDLGIGRGRRRLSPRTSAGDPRRCAGDGRPTSTAMPSQLQLNPQYLAPVLTAQAAMRGLTEAAVLDRARARCWRAPVSSSRSASRMSAEDALRRAQQGEVVDHDRRPRRAGARPGPAQRVQRSVISMSAGLSNRGCWRIGRRRSSRPRNTSRLEVQRSGFQITFAVIYHPGRDAVPRGGDPDRDPFRGAAGRSDQRPGRRRRAQSAPAICRRACRRASRTTNSARSAAPSTA